MESNTLSKYFSGLPRGSRRSGTVTSLIHFPVRNRHNPSTALTRFSLTMPRYTQKIPSLNTSPDRAAMGIATTHRGGQVDEGGHPYVAATPEHPHDVGTLHGAQGMTRNIMVSIMVQMSAAEGVSLNRG